MVGNLNREGDEVNARRKLNAVHIAGDVLLAGIGGLLLRSWPLFFVALAVLIGLDLHTGRVRPKPHKRRGPSGTDID